MAADTNEQQELLQEIEFLTKLINQHKDGRRRKPAHKVNPPKDMSTPPRRVLQPSKTWRRPEKESREIKLSVPNIQKSQAAARGNHDGIKGGKIPQEICSERSDNKNIKVEKRGNCRTVVYSMKSRGGNGKTDDMDSCRKLAFDANRLKVSIKNTISPDDVPSGGRTVVAPVSLHAARPSCSTSTTTCEKRSTQFIAPTDNKPSKLRTVLTAQNSFNTASHFASAKKVNTPACSQPSKNFSKYRWYAGNKAKGHGTSELGKVPAARTTSVLCKSHLQKLDSFRGKPKHAGSALPKPLRTSTPEISPVTPKQSYRYRSKLSNKNSSLKQKSSSALSHAKYLRSKYSMRKINLSHSNSTLPQRHGNVSKGVVVVRSRTKLIKKHVTGHSDGAIGYPTKKLSTSKYVYRSPHKLRRTNVGVKEPNATPRSHRRWPSGMSRSTRYRYRRNSASFPSRSGSFAWNPQRTLKRNHDVELLSYLNRLLRKNLSTNRYKYISASTKKGKKTNTKIDLSSKRPRPPAKSKLKLDRRTHPKPGAVSGRFVLINGFLYKSSARKLEKAGPSFAPVKKKKIFVIRKLSAAKMKTVTVRGVKFRMDASGKTLQRVDAAAAAEGKGISTTASKNHFGLGRIDIGGVTYLQTKPGTLVRATNLQNRIAASYAVQRSKAVVAASRYRKTKRQYCLFYNRFGKCNKGEKCPHVHDPEKVAICKRFLRGMCDISDCPFSHKLSKEKMPVCSYFLRGVCTRENCPYLHVKVNQDAAVCQAFLNGFCALGEKCKKQHTLVCQTYANTGTCLKGKSCKLLHPRKRKRSRPVSYGMPLKRRAMGTAAPEPTPATDDGGSNPSQASAPRRCGNLEAAPAFIALGPDSPDLSPPSQASVGKPSLQIRPNFT